jgi:hypothetical protein
MSSRPVDAAVVEAFLEAVSPLSLAVSLQVLEQVEQDRAAQRRQQELQLEQARYEARLAQRQYDAVDPEHRLVASELERRWNEKLERVARLEQAYGPTPSAANEALTVTERAAIQKLAQDLGTLWQAETTTQAERKQLLRLAIESVQLEGVRQPGEVELQIRWRSGTVTRKMVKRVAPGDCSLKTPAGAVARIHQLAPQHSFVEMAEQLNAEGWRTAFGRLFSYHHVAYLCRRDGLGRGSRKRQESSIESRTQVGE